jgi:rubrerythrin
MKLILEAVIEFEEKSYCFYQAALKKSVMTDSFDLLKQLMSEELKHRMRLDELQKRTDLALPQRNSTLPVPREYTVEVPFHGICSEWPDLTAEDSRKDILEAAVHREICSHRFYKNMARSLQGNEMRLLFENLMNEENRHMALIQAELVRVGT